MVDKSQRPAIGLNWETLLGAEYFTPKSGDWSVKLDIIVALGMFHCLEGKASRENVLRRQAMPLDAALIWHIRSLKYGWLSDY